jgi:hypothetical protein
LLRRERQIRVMLEQLEFKTTEAEVVVEQVLLGVF